MKKILLYTSIFCFFAVAIIANADTLRILTAPQGGTGIGTASVGDVGNCLKVAGNSPFTYSLGTCGSGGGAGSGGGTWSTTTSNVTGRFINYPNNNTDIVTVGNTATTTAPVFFDPNTLVNYFKGFLGIGTTSPYAPLSVVGSGGIVADKYNATSTTATSTFAGGLTVQTTGLVVQQNSGNVGIGTSTPQTKLNVHETNAINQQLLLSNTGTYHTGLIGSSNGTNYLTDNNAWGIFGGPNTYLWGGGGANQTGVVLGSGVPSYNIRFTDSNLNSATGDTRLTVLNAGNVGIGITNPTALLTVSKSYAEPPGGIASSTVAVFSNNNAALATSSISILSRSSAPSRINFGSESGERSGYIDYQVGALVPYVAGTMRLGTLGVDGLVIDGNHNVGVGSSTPEQPLMVNGVNGIGLGGNQGTFWPVLRRSSSGALTVSSFDENAQSYTQTVVFQGTNNNGNVGIGTTTPQKDLVIEDTATGNTVPNQLQFESKNISTRTYGMGIVDGGTLGANFAIADLLAGTPRFTINSNGGILIATSTGGHSSASPLTVYGNSTTIAPLFLTTANSTDAPWVELHANGLGVGNEILGSITNSNGFRFNSVLDISMIPGATSAFKILNTAKTSTYFTVLGASGNTGVGTSTPDGLLTVNSATGAAGDLLYVVNGSTAPSNNGILIGSNNSGAPAASRNWDLVANTNVYGDFGIRTGASIFAAPSLTRLYIDPSGYVGIGTSTPGTALTVNGTITATSTAPTLSSCGTNPSVVGSNNWGKVTAGASATGCTVTFSTAYPSAAACAVTAETGSITNTFSYTVSKTAIVVTETGLGGNKFDYSCGGY